MACPDVYRNLVSFDEARAGSEFSGQALRAHDAQTLLESLQEKPEMVGIIQPEIIFVERDVRDFLRRSPLDWRLAPVRKDYYQFAVQGVKVRQRLAEIILGNVPSNEALQDARDFFSKYAQAYHASANPDWVKENVCPYY